MFIRILCRWVKRQVTESRGWIRNDEVAKCEDKIWNFWLRGSTQIADSYIGVKIKGLIGEGGWTI